MLWLSLAYFALQPGNRAPQALHDMITSMESGEPGWLAAIDRNAAALVAHQGLAASIVLAAALVLIAVGVYLPPPAARGHPDPGHRGGRGDLGRRRGIRDHPHRRRHGPQLRAAARPAGADLLAGPDHGHAASARALLIRPRRSGRRDDGMMTPAWILDIFAAVMLVVAAVSAARLVAARPWQHGSVVLADTDIAHLLMAIAMAGMLAASLQTLPNGAWEVIFGVLTAWFGYRVTRDARIERHPRAGGRALRAAPRARRGDAVHVPGRHGPAAGGSGMAGMGGSSSRRCRR